MHATPGRRALERHRAVMGFDVAVIGGGVIGLASAWRARQAGAAVAVVDEAPGRAASWAAAGMLAPVTEAHYGEEALLRLNLAAASVYPRFVAELEEASGRAVGYRDCGTLVVARDLDENAALEDLYRFQRGLGLAAQRLRGRACRELEPGLAPGVRGGILVEGDNQVDNRALAEALESACGHAGVAFVRARATEVTISDRVTGVRLADGGAVRCDAAVLAAGCWSGALGGIPPEARPPVRPVAGQLLHLRARGQPFPAARTVRGLGVYVVPRADGRVVIGATVEERGFDATATAGGVLGLLRDAYELLPGITELELVEVATGLRPGSPDNAPLVGPAGVDGLVVATGHYRNGILLAPVTADCVAEILVGGTVPELIQPFSPLRFEPVSGGAR